MNVPTPIRYLPTISEHVRTHFGDDSFVLHEAVSSTIHVDIHVVRPTTVKTEDGRIINFLAIVPIHPNEMKFRFENGSIALANRLFDAGVNEVLCQHRPSVL